MSTGYLEQLKTDGYAVIPNIFTAEEADLLRLRLWKEYIEVCWPDCNYDDPSTWAEFFPQHQGAGIFCGPAGQTQVLWDIRSNPKIAEVYAQIWGCTIWDLVVSMDGFNLMCPTSIRPNNHQLPPHVDQSSTEPGLLNVQGMILLEDSFEGDGGFYCLPKSHLEFDLPASIREQIEDQEQRRQFYFNYFDQLERKHVIASRGSLIIWDSRTVHWNQFSSNSDLKVRTVAYLCYAPKERLTAEAIELRKQAFENTSTGHDPIKVELKYSEPPHLWDEYKQFISKVPYQQPKIELTELGRSLLGV